MSRQPPAPARGLLDLIVDFEFRHRRAISVSGALWLALSCAVYARFLELPDIPFITDRMALYTSAAFNAAWWGFMRPALDRRSRRRMGTDKTSVS